MTAAATDDIRRRLDAAPMSRAQVAAVAVTVALSALDGYDVLSVTFAAPAISAAWGIGKLALGLVLSAGLAGMALGSFLLAPLADLVGRRRMVFASLGLMAMGMLLSAFAVTVPQLSAWRVVTGLGIGTMVAVINPLAAEFSNARHRAMALSLMTIGYPIGGLVGGLVAALLLRLYGWPAVFMAGCAFAVLMAPVVARFLPEPLAFLVARPRGDSLARVNALLARCGHSPVDRLPPKPARYDAGYPAVFARGQIATTARITAVNALYVVMVYYLFSWLPQIVADAGFSPSTASLVAAVVNLSGIVGGIALGWLAQRAALKTLTVGFIAAAGMATAAFGSLPASLPLMFVVASVCGFFVFGGMSGLYATLATSFTAEARASGTGFVIGVGRVASAAAPAFAGWLFAGGLGWSAVSLAFGLCAVMAAAVLATGRPGRELHRPRQ